jgi:hypothetical protein
MGANGAAPSVFRWISGSMRVPHYMTKGAAPSATLVIDENNKPVYQVWSWAERAWGHRHTHQLNHESWTCGGGDPGRGGRHL